MLLLPLLLHQRQRGRLARPLAAWQQRSGRRHWPSGLQRLASAVAAAQWRSWGHRLADVCGPARTQAHHEDVAAVHVSSAAACILPGFMV